MIHVFSKPKPEQYVLLTFEVLNMDILLYGTVYAVIKVPLLIFGIYSS